VSDIKALATDWFPVYIYAKISNYEPIFSNPQGFPELAGMDTRESIYQLAAK